MNYKKLKEWWTKDVDEGCISFISYRNTESSKIVFKRWRGDFLKKKSTARFINKDFLKELTQNDWSISKNQQNGRVYERKTENKEYHFDYCFEFDTNTESRFVRFSFNRLCKIKTLPVLPFSLFPGVL